MATISKKSVDALKADPDRDMWLWDDKLSGFGVRRKPSGAASFLIQYKTPQGATRRLVIGRVGTLTPDQARELARQRLGEVAEGRDPSKERHEERKELSVGQVCDLYLEAARAGQVITRFGQKKAGRTVEWDHGRVDRHIRPLIGDIIASKLTRQDVQRMVDAIAAGRTATVVKTKARGKAVVTGGPGTAARAVGLLGAIWKWAERRGYTSGENPAHGVDKAASGAKDRVLGTDELRKLGAVLKAMEEAHPAPVAAVRLIAFTGLRREEAVGLRWPEIDELGSCLRLQATKTGRSTRPVGRSVLDLLKSMPRRHEDWVFPNRDGTAPADLKKPIAAIFDAAGLSDARSHDLRRTFATVAATEGYSDATIGELLGHSRRGVTERHYIRRPDAALIGAADRVSRHIGALMCGAEAAEVIALPIARQIS